MFLSGCGKSDGSCITNAGEVTREPRTIQDFDTINVADHVDLIIIPDSVNRIEVEAGKNVIRGITTRVENRTLYIRNENRCNWLRSYTKPLNVYIHARNISKIDYNSSGNITTTDTLYSGYLSVDLWGGCGIIDLKLHVINGYFILHLGTATLITHGVCHVGSVYAGDYGLLRLEDMKTGYTYVKNQGTNDCYVNAINFLDATLNSVGNIYFNGDPDSIRVQENGSGKLIHL